MGGNALKNCTGRFDLNIYYMYSGVILDLLKKKFGDIRIEVVKSYHSKDSFGDLDILIESDTIDIDNFRSDIIKLFDSKDSHRTKNSNVISAEFKGTQVDLILTKSEYFDYSANYYAYNDLGNLIGRIAKKFGLKFGWSGLWYPLQYGVTIPVNVLITRNFDDSLKFLGLDPRRYHRGFDTLDDIFKYVSSSMYFDIEDFLLENRSNSARSRDAKRNNYHKFLAWCKENKPLNRHYVGESLYIGLLFKNFPEFKTRYDYQIMRSEKLRLANKKLNGNVVGELLDNSLNPSDKGKLIRNILNDIKIQLGYSEDFYKYSTTIIDMSEDQIRELILNRLKS